MPSDGRRKLVILAVRDGIRLVDGTAPYFSDLSGNYTVQLGRESLGSLTEGKNPVAVRIYDGLDSQIYRGVNAEVEADLEVIVVVVVRNSSGTLVERLNDVIADIELAVGLNRSGGGDCTDLRIKSIDPPNYDFEREVATAIIRIAGSYSYTAGVDR